MIEFLVRARAAPVNPSHFKGLIGKGYGLEYLADIVRNGLFVSNSLTPDQPTLFSTYRQQSVDLRSNVCKVGCDRTEMGLCTWQLFIRHYLQMRIKKC